MRSGRRDSGRAMHEAEQGMNVARIASLRAGIPVEAGGDGEQLLLIGLKEIAMRRARDVRVRDHDRRRGTESMSLVPMAATRLRRTRR